LVTNIFGILQLLKNAFYVTLELYHRFGKKAIAIM